MEKKWNLQDIRPAEPRQKRAPTADQPLEMAPRQRVVEDEDDGTIRIGVENGNTKKRNRLIIALIIFFVIVGAGFLVSVLLGGAEITVYPRHREPNVNAVFTAYRTPQVGELSYEIMSLEAEGERQVSATGQEEVSTQATGVITIFNETPNTERLIKNTRFRSEDGLIFKITESAVVPGAREDSDGTLVPGTIQATVFAEAPGEEYNLQPTRLNVPGYEEGGYTELYNALYAKNDVAFTGGFEGPKFIVNEQELETEKQSLQTELRNALLDRIPAERPSGFVVFPDAVTFTYQTLPAVEYGENLVTIKEKALLQIPVFKEEAFASYIAAATVPGYEGQPVRIEAYDVFDFSYTSASTSAIDIGNQDSLSFQLTGKPRIVWTFDEGKLKTDIMGKNKTALPAVLGGYSAIERAEAVVKPFWKQSFPDELEEITIIEVVEKAEENQ